MKVTFAGAVKSALVNFAKFRGTSTRPEYWYFVLFSVLVALVLGTIDSVIWPPVETEDLLEALNQPTPFSNIFAILLLVPSLAVTSRRIRDAGWSGKWLWTLLVPLLFLVFAVVEAVSYLEFVSELTAEDGLALAGLLLPVLVTAFLVQIFLLVLCLLPSKSKEAGNRYAE
jgi:uncharacterized membrane protein YhaH (DUF805 family)